MFKVLITLPRWAKKIIFVLHDAVLIFCSFWLALGLRLPIQPEWHDTKNWYILAGTIIISILAFIRLGLYRAILRYVGLKTLTTILFGGVASVAAMLATAFYLHIPFPRSVPIMYFLLVIVLLAGSRLVLKTLLQSKNKQACRPVIIYGAGDSGRQLLESIKQVNRYFPVAFVDDDKALHHTVIHNTPVYSPKTLPDLVEKNEVESILLAIPSASQQQRKEIITQLETLPCKILTMPGLQDLVEGKISVNHLKNISVIDLLGREAIEPIPELMEKNIKGKIVIVTGAGGSIGAELCRQIVRQLPEKLILFELSEHSLYRIEKELMSVIDEQALPVKIIPAMGSVQHLRRLTELMKRFDVQTVYHAAAYKHVPLVEYNTIEGVRNNIFGTLRCAQAAIDAQVETFVLISTDKAVRPTNTMGATKRMAELILQALADRDDHSTRFCMVRFGNVLGSSGSVIPLFEQQIAAGGPVTVTHPEITRYFMTIPEAAQLVIQAGAMGEGGDVFLLDMGDAVKITDLARKMIHLSGLEVKDEASPHGDIALEFTGLRPGEKLYEELLVGENATGTNHPRIMASKEEMLSWDALSQILADLDTACQAFQPEEVRRLLLKAPVDFQPKDEVCDIILTSASPQ